MLERTKQYMEDMTPLQKQIILTLLKRIRDCEGKDMPKKYWCKSCKAAWNRANELSLKFIRMNAAKAWVPPINDTGRYNFFGPPDSTMNF